MNFPPALKGQDKLIYFNMWFSSASAPPPFFFSFLLLLILQVPLHVRGGDQRVMKPVLWVAVGVDHRSWDKITCTRSQVWLRRRHCQRTPLQHSIGEHSPWNEGWWLAANVSMAFKRHRPCLLYLLCLLSQVIPGTRECLKMPRSNQTINDPISSLHPSLYQVNFP